MARLCIKDIAASRGITQQNTLVEMSGVTAQLLNRYWNNNVRRPDLDELAKIAKALGVKTGDLIVDVDEDVRRNSAR